MNEVERLLAERDAVLKVIEQQEAKILIEIDGGDFGNKKIIGIKSKINEEAELEWIKDLDVTNYTKRFIQCHESLSMLWKEKFDIYSSYMDKILGNEKVVTKLEKQNEEPISSVPGVLKAKKGTTIGKFSEQARVDFIDEVKRRIIEINMVKHYDPKKAKAKRIAIYTMCPRTDESRDEKKAIIDSLLESMSEPEVAEESEEQSDEQEVQDDEQ
jgi:hypothetical protein